MAETPSTELSDRDVRLALLARRRWRVGLTLTAIMIAVYFGFIALIAYGRPLLATRIGAGLTVGIVLGALVIVASWVLTYVYVWWANAHYDPELVALRGDRPSEGVR